LQVSLFDPFPIRGVTLRNRIVMSPMCQYAAGADGRLTDWHLVHLGSRAVGGAGLVMVEATSVEPRGRLSERDSGLWNEEQVPPLARIVRFVHEQGACAGIQLAHAGRQAWEAQRGFGPEALVGPSPLPFGSGWRVPDALDDAGIEHIVAAFQRGAALALAAGFDVLELHAAHGYLLHTFLSPLSNQRSDDYGGTLEGRARLLARVVEGVRREWPATRPLFVRLSCSDWAEGGITPEDCARVARSLRSAVDVVDCSSGGLISGTKNPEAPAYQVPFAELVRRTSGVATCAVGLLTDPRQCEAVLQEGRADLVALGRELLRDPYWPLRAAASLGIKVSYVPKQYRMLAAASLSGRILAAASRVRGWVAARRS
jgi:NADPH2 dehydrogenase